jgi:hypothetical protein
MVKVANIKVEELDRSKTPAYKKCLALVPDLEKLLPKRKKVCVSFELKDTVTEMANAIRRVLINELPSYYLDYDEFKDLDTSDPYILCDFIKKQIEMLPLMANVNEEKDIALELHKENKTTEIIDVTTDHFVVKKGPALDKIVTNGITLCRLRPGEYIHIKNIHVAVGIGKNDPGKWEPFSNVYYEPLIKPFDEKSGVSSLVSNPTHFLIKYTTRRNVEANKAKDFMKQVCSVLEERLKIIMTQVESIPKTEYYATDILEMETKGSIREVRIKNEKWTLITLICRYCYILTKGNIKFITSSEIHPEVNTGIIRINHPEYKKLILDAIKKIMIDLKTIASAF